MEDFLMKHKAALATAIVIITLLVFGYFIANKKGYRVSIFGIEKFGELLIVSDTPDSLKVFINESEKNADTSENEKLSVKLVSGKYSAIISKFGYYPWTKNISIEKNTATEIKPFFIPLKPEIKEIKKSDAGYGKIYSEIVRTDLPSQSHKKQSSDKNVEIWSDGYSIYSAWAGDMENTPTFYCIAKKKCLNKILVVSSSQEIQNLDFYKNRNDVIIFSTKNGSIYAIETDPNNNQNFQPIYFGQRPMFIKSEDGNLNILDGNTLSKIIL